MAELQTWPNLIFGYAVGLLWNFLMFLNLIYNIATKGPKAFFGGPSRHSRPACLEDESLGKHAYIRLKDVKLHYVESGPADKPLMVLLHGFPECWYSWRYQIPEFNQNYRVVAVDMRGYGDSDKPSAVKKYHMDYLVGDIQQLIEALGHKTCVLVGHDWGGIVAQQVALVHPDLITRLVLCNIPHMKPAEENIRRNPSQFLKSWYMFMFQLPFFPEIFLQAFDYQFMTGSFQETSKGCSRPPCDQDELEAYKHYFSKKGTITGGVNYYRAAFRYMPLPVKSWTIQPPTLMVWGTQDKFINKALAENSVKYFDKISLKFIETAGHWVQMEEPAKVNDYIREFLKGKKAE